MKSNHLFQRRSAAGLVVALVTLLVVMLIAGSIVRSLVTDARESRHAAIELQAHALADAALARAAATLKTQPDYTGETWRPEIKFSDDTNTGIADIRVQRPPDENQSLTITIDAHFPDHPVHRVAVTRSYSGHHAPRAEPKPTEQSTSRTSESAP
jgi:Tfp pilus assembly protein PilX